MADLSAIPDQQSRRAVAEALASYTAAWNDGAIPYQTLRFRALQAQRMDALERAAAAERDYRAALKPAIDELAAYGKGGVSQDAILSLLSNLGLAGAILGDNQ